MPVVKPSWLIVAIPDTFRFTRSALVSLISPVISASPSIKTVPVNVLYPTISIAGLVISFPSGFMTSRVSKKPSPLTSKLYSSLGAALLMPTPISSANRNVAPTPTSKPFFTRKF